MQGMSYQALSVDGSQVYPDRHQGTACCLINIGTVAIEYNALSSVSVMTNPYLFLGADMENIPGPEFINCHRQELEFKGGLELYQQIASHEGQPKVLLFDGSLIFWHLKEQAIKERFMPVYIAQLHQLYLKKTLFACYISLPKNKELTNLLRTLLCNFTAPEQGATTPIDHVTDAALAGFFLDPWTRTTVFESNHEVCKEYPAHLRPHFVYMHIDDEIARIEFPAWIAQDAQALNTLMMVIADQCRKGRGYPVVLAEAHEQAVIKGPDREFFYQLITKMGIEQRQRVVMSQKSIKKRGISI
jgi:hypothetical protein